MSYYYNILHQIHENAINNVDSFFGWYNTPQLDDQKIKHLKQAGLIITEHSKKGKIKLTKEGSDFMYNYEKADLTQKLLLENGITQSILQCTLTEIKKGNQSATILSLIAITIATIAICVTIFLSSPSNKTYHNYCHHTYKRHNN
jgi:predicted transcriptional regulator